MPEPGEFIDCALEAKEAFASSIGFIATHHCRPLFSGHGAGAGISQKIDQKVAGFDEE